MKNPADQIAQLRDQLIALENNSQVLTEGAMDFIKNIVGVGKAAAPVARELRSGATAVHNGTEFVLNNKQWVQKNKFTGKPSGVKATPDQADALNATAMKDPQMLLHPEAALIKSDAKAFVNNTHYERQPNGEWMERTPASPSYPNGQLKPVSPAEQAAAETAAVADKGQHKPPAPNPAAQQPNPAAQQPGAAANTVASSILQSVLSRFGIMNNPEAAKQVMFHKTQMGKVIMGGVLGTSGAKFEEAITETPPNMKKVQALGGVALASALGVGINPLGLAIAFGSYYMWSQEPLTTEEQQEIANIVDEYVKSGKIPDPKTDKRISDPKILKGFKALYERKKKNAPTPAPAASTTAASTTAASTPTSKSPSTPTAAPTAAAPTAAAPTAAAPTAAAPTAAAPTPAANPPAPTAKSPSTKINWDD